MKLEIEEKREFTITFPKEELIRILREAGYKIPDDPRIFTNSFYDDKLKLFVSWVEEQNERNG